jgi:glycogen debranching enzyme
MAALGEIPFGRYYGTVDATPLFVALAGAYYDRTGDRATIEHLWPNITAALRWIQEHGDHDGDGFVEYSRKSSGGLVTQGWKDSPDSVFHAAEDGGGLAEPPIALCEVQGYVYAAYHAAARLCDALDEPVEEVTGWVRRAEALRQKFDDAFWLDDLHTYALALDGRKRPCRVRASNAGHCLFSGIALPDRAARVAHQLFDGPMFSGWGIRTVATGEARYNPMSYHNGSVWPHDNAMIALGLSRYGLNERAARVCEAMFAVAQHVDLHRLPELFCGFHRRSGEGPTLYPVACSPQTWAAGAAFMLLQACLGLEIEAPRDRVTLRRPALPESVDELHICGLRVTRDSRVDLSIRRHVADVSVAIDRRQGQAEVVIIK